MREKFSYFIKAMNGITGEVYIEETPYNWICQGYWFDKKIIEYVENNYHVFCIGKSNIYNEDDEYRNIITTFNFI